MRSKEREGGKEASDDEPVPQGRMRNAQPSPEGIRGTMKRVLFVDDERDIREILCEIFGGKGFSAAQAPDGREALSMFQSGGYDVVVSDISMPFMDGFELLRRVRKASPLTPVIIISGGSEDESRAALSAGAFSVVRKPFDLGELENEIIRALSSLRP